MQINDFVKEVHELAKLKGWHDDERTALEIHALIHSEVSEATEAVRKDKPPVYLDGSSDSCGKILPSHKSYEHFKTQFKPEGQAVELADAVIRICDYFGAMGWDLEQILLLKHEYNKTRPYRHGFKKL